MKQEQISVWNYEFNEIKNYLLKYLPELKMEHIGFTAIPAPYTKEVIDILLILPNINELPFVNDVLAMLEYDFVGETDIQGLYETKHRTAILPPHQLWIGIESYPGRILPGMIVHHLSENAEKYELFKKIKNDIKQKKDFFKEFAASFFAKQIVKPDFNNSLINLSSSIAHFFGMKNNYSSLPVVDEWIKDCKHVILLVLDGMGSAILENHLSAGTFLRKRQVHTMTSIFPPTTAAATTALISGLLPGESGWVGWQQYFHEVKQHLILFRNENYYTGTVLEEPIVQQKLNYQPIYKLIKDGKGYELFPSFRENGYDTFEKMKTAIQDLIHLDEKNYIYAYWHEPDFLLHEYGVSDQKIKDNLLDLNNQIEQLALQCPEDTCLIVTADHGLIDIDTVELTKFPSLFHELIRLPSIEGRCASFAVKNKENFKTEFLRYFKNHFLLFDRESFLNSGLLGNQTNKAEEFIDDFIAIATNRFYLTAKTDGNFFRAAHAGMTKEEMLVPLILYRKGKE